MTKEQRNYKLNRNISTISEEEVDNQSDETINELYNKIKDLVD